MCVNISIYDNIYLTYTIYFYQCSWTQTNPGSHTWKFINYMNFRNKFLTINPGYCIMYILSLSQFPWIKMSIVFLNERWCRSERTNNGRTFLRFFRADFWNNDHVFIERTFFFEQTFETMIMFLLHEGPLWTIVHEKTNKIDEKWTVILTTNKINFLLNDWKNERNMSFANVERTNWNHD